MKKKLLTIAAGLAITMTSCVGPSNAYNTLNTWNGRATENKWLNELIYVGMWVIPVYEIALAADALVLNSIEFWSGENPVKTPEPYVLKGNEKKTED